MCWLASSVGWASILPKSRPEGGLHSIGAASHGAEGVCMPHFDLWKKRWEFPQVPQQIFGWLQWKVFKVHLARSDIRIYSGQRWKRLGNSLEPQSPCHKVTTQTQAVENPGSLLKMISKREQETFHVNPWGMYPSSVSAIHRFWRIISPIGGSWRRTKPHPILETQLDQLWGELFEVENPSPTNRGRKNWFLLRFKKVFVTEGIWKFLSGSVLSWQRLQIFLKGSMIAKWMRNNCWGTLENQLQSWPWLNNLLASGFESLRHIPQEPNVVERQLDQWNVTKTTWN